MKETLIIMSFLASLFGANAQELDEIKILDPQEYRSHISKGDVQLVDVRTAREFLSGHIRGAINIDALRPATFGKQFEKLNKEKPLYIYCRSGMRSMRAAQQLVQMGFQQIYDLEGGYINWQ